jgi:hypothetical protein
MSNVWKSWKVWPINDDQEVVNIIFRKLISRRLYSGYIFNFCLAPSWAEKTCIESAYTDPGGFVTAETSFCRPGTGDQCTPWGPERSKDLLEVWWRPDMEGLVNAVFSSTAGVHLRWQLDSSEHNLAVWHTLCSFYLPPPHCQNISSQPRHRKAEVQPLFIEGL